MLLGLTISSIAAHARFCNLNLNDSLKIGLVSGLMANATFIISSYYILNNKLLTEFTSLIALSLTGTALVLWRFFRDPERVYDGSNLEVISPADGKIIYIREINKGTIPCSIKGKKNIKITEILKTDLLEKSDGFIIGINMSLLDVHVNRAPISGKALLVKHTPGNLISLKQGSSEIENVRNTIIIKNGKCSIGIIQIGSKLVSKIICYLKQNEHIERGGRIGKITFGSQVDVIFRKEDVEVLLVTEGTLVYAGLTPIARLKANQVDKESDLT